MYTCEADGFTTIPTCEEAYKMDGMGRVAVK
jgi:hypothetical protein